MDENDDEFDMDFDMADVLAVMEQVESHTQTAASHHHQSSNSNPVHTNNVNHMTTADTFAPDYGNSNGGDDDDDDDFGDDFDDFDVDALVQAADTVEKQKATSTTTFGGKQVQSSLSAHFGNTSTTTNAPQAMSSTLNQPTGSNHHSNLSNTANATAGSSNARITFGMPEDMEDPTPPAPPPSDAKTFHPFDSSNLPTWIYPTNHPIRGYQFNIVRKALFSNTLVSIPTGLGKTFIAAVVMYNYFRWFPNSIMIFMAPTRPLVEQQIKACHDICGIPQKDTVMMVGTGGKVKRPELWAKGRVFFCTPQVVDNDLTNGICPSHKVALLVIDEAHKATGNYAYTNVIEKLERIHSHFRVLALSATPGSTVDKVQAVVNNLRINTVEVRTEESMDVQEFSFGKRVQTIVIKLNYTSGATGIVPRTAESFCQLVLQPVLDRLAQRKAIFCPTVERCSPFALLNDRKTYQVNAKNVPPAVKRLVTVDFLLAEAFARAYEGLCVYGVPTFVDIVDKFLQSIRTAIQEGKNVPSENYKILNHFGLKQLLDQLRPQLATTGFIGHPKLDSLLNIILRHFNELSGNHQHLSDDLASASSSSRIIVFSSLRASVNMIVDFLSVHHPMIRCAAFVGQAGDTQGAKGMSQKEQQETIERFKKGDVNVMVATCIGEEGLDIGEVDLIVCYDSQSSSIRLLQRMGRTGRRRQGHCVMLMTEQEERKFKKATDSYKFIQNTIAKRNVIECCKETPTLLPESYMPVVQRKRLVIGNYLTTMVKGKKRRRQGGNAAGFQKDGTLSDEGLEAFMATFPDGNYTSSDQVYDRFWPLYHPLKGALKYLSLQQKQTRTKYVDHSHRTLQFTSLMKKMEHRILNGPDDGEGDTMKSSQETYGSNNHVLKLPRKRKPAINSSSPSDETDVYSSTKANSSKLILPTSRNSRALLATNMEASRSKEDSDIMEDVLDGPEETDWHSFMEPLMTKGMAEDEDNCYADYQSDYDFTVDNESPIEKSPPITTTLPSDNSIDGDIEVAKRDVDDKKQLEMLLEDELDDDFGGMDLDFWDDLETEALKTGRQQQNTQGSALPPSGFLFDDDLPPLVSEDELKSESVTSHSSAAFSTSFVWATSNPVFSEQARKILINRFQNSNNHYLSVKMQGNQCGIGKSAKHIDTSNSSPLPVPPPQEPSKSLTSYDFDDDIDMSKLDDIGDLRTEGTAISQPKYVDREASEKLNIMVDDNNCDNNINHYNSSTSDDKVNLDNGIPADTSSIEWSIIDSQPAHHETKTSNIPPPQPNTVNIETDTEQEEYVNNHQNNNYIPGRKSPSFSNTPVEKMDGDSMDSWEINDDGLNTTTSNHMNTTPLEKEDNHVESPMPVISITPTAIDMTSSRLMHSTPQGQQPRDRFGKGDFESRSQYLYSPTDDSNHRSPLRLVSPRHGSSMKITETCTPTRLDSDSHDSPIIRRRNRTGHRPIIRDSEDEDCQSGQDDSNTTNMEGSTKQHPPLLNEPPSVIVDLSSDEDEGKIVTRHKKETNRRQNQQQQRSKRWAANPFLDNEAERSDDGVDTGDEDDDDADKDESNVMDSFIYDGSSELAPEGGGGNSSLMTTQDDDGDGEHRMLKKRETEDGNDMAMYRTSLLQRDVAARHGAPSPPVFGSGFHRKTWLDKMETKKWEYVAHDEEDDDNEDDDDNGDEVFHDASDIYNDDLLDAPTVDGASEDISRFTNASDDFM
ncbi:hypothetical protein BCR42DRAFT_409611 [Absidia repens]|uniref:DNA helicase n=1 Tax=Absidia repens TaxID=90262 RepID=A0A1X2IMU5_9FUNG|nr:hypothetical protein BCR42DRAFT_409611 [Absidia repens]